MKGVPIAGLALQSLSAANAWTPPSVVASPSSSSRARGGGGSRRQMKTTTPPSAPHRAASGSSTIVMSSSSSSSSAETTEIDIDSLNLTPELRMMTEAFSSIPDERTRHKQLLYMASKLPDVDDDVRVPENKVPGCLSQVYVDCAATMAVGSTDDNDDGDRWTVEYRGDSDGLLTKGLLALLVRGLSGHTPDEIGAVDPKFVRAARISQTLTPGRNNGFLNMLAVMKRKAREAVERERSGGGDADDVGVATTSTSTSTSTSTEPVEGGPMYNAILAALTTSLKPRSMKLVDDSSKHAGHAGSNGFDGGESHFSLEVVSDAFEGLNLVARHKLIYALLGEVMPRIHALAIVARTPSEVE